MDRELVCYWKKVWGKLTVKWTFQPCRMRRLLNYLKPHMFLELKFRRYLRQRPYMGFNASNFTNESTVLSTGSFGAGNRKITISPLWTDGFSVQTSLTNASHGILSKWFPTLRVPTKSRVVIMPTLLSLGAREIVLIGNLRCCQWLQFGIITTLGFHSAYSWSSKILSQYRTLKFIKIY